MLTFIVARGVDAQNSDFLNNKGCPLAQGVNRRLKKGFYCMAYTNAVHIYNAGGVKVYESILPKCFGADRYQAIRTSGKNVIVKVEIPNEFLKRVHKPRVKVVAAPIPQIDKVRTTADILDKVYPNWKDVSLVGCSMSSGNDCFLRRIGKFHNDNRAYYELRDSLLEQGYANDANCFCSVTTVEMWQQVIAERKAAEEAAKPKFDRPRHADAMREVAKILDKVFPKWRGVDLTFLDMYSVTDCLLQRIGKMHGLEGATYNGLLRFLEIHGYEGVLFCANTTPHDWAIIIAEKS